MLPSNTNANTTTTTSLSNYTSPLPFFIDFTPNSKQEDPLLSLFHYPSPFLHYEDDAAAAAVFFPQHHDLLQPSPKQQQPTLLTSHINTAPQESLLQVNNMFDSNKNSTLKEIMGNSKSKTSHRVVSDTPRRRSSKRDRHSKINTAQGPRDRRMRLSLDIARQFFDLQDMLGYDKASKTVEWLLSKAKAEIKKLRGLVPAQMKGSCSIGCTTKSASSTSEGEVVSGSIIDEVAVPINENQISKVLKASTTSVIKEKRSRQLRKGAFHTQARESREKARARARERTREKMMCSNRRLYESTSTANQDLNQVGNSWSPFEESGSQSHNNMNPLMEVLQADQVEEFQRQHAQLGTNTSGGDMGDESLASIGKWSPSPILHYLHNSTGIFQEHQFADFDDQF